MRVALFQPDIPQNTGSILRLCACMGVGLDIIEPCGFVFDDRRIRRAGMDYIEQASYTRHTSWEAFLEQKQGRIVLFTTKSTLSYLDFAYREGDILLFGRESAGVPDVVASQADAKLTIPIVPGTRSLNVAMSAAMGLAEALRYTQNAGKLP